ncbi:42283_t:CDS:2 [Gigaspora margarita]|uniref:42283_t:CDS:1 n=1 Tax=Gigaspora margarita TaxID=4874 RepID=A0ABM8W689_GIGMA|nr:42283_t:CDS:2 [Gigaspora margarita]
MKEILTANLAQIARLRDLLIRSYDKGNYAQRITAKTITKGSSASNESSDTIAASTSQHQEGQDLDRGIDNQARTYIDTVIQSTAVAIMRNMQHLMEQQIETQRQWNVQYMEIVNQRFARLEQMNLQNNDNNSDHNNDSGHTTAERSQQCTIETNKDTGTSQDNCSPTPTINNLLIRASLEGASENGVKAYKSTARKYPAINYDTVKEIPSIQDFQNTKAAETEKKKEVLQ